MTTNSKCSAKHMNEFKESINKYLKTHNINDYSKYTCHISNDKLVIVTWEYENIPRPPANTIQPIAIQPKYLDLQARVIIFSVENIAETVYLNSIGNIVSENYIDDYYIEYIVCILVAINLGGGLNRYQWAEIRDTYAINGLIKISGTSKISTSTGKIRISFFFSSKKQL
jgi:hypothetical protein